MTTAKSTIDLNAISTDALTAILKIDASFVGTENYMGIAYFWGQEFKHTLREQTPAVLRRVHAKLLAAGIDIGGDGPEYAAIVNKCCKRDLPQYA